MSQSLDAFLRDGGFVSENAAFEEEGGQFEWSNGLGMEGFSHLRPSYEPKTNQNLAEDPVAEPASETIQTPKQTLTQGPTDSRKVRLGRGHDKSEQLKILKALVNSPQDGEGLLRRIKERINRAGLVIPTVEIRFQDLHAETTVFADLSRNLPSIFRAIRDPWEALLQRLWLMKSARRQLVILDHVSGILKPGRMTLLLGPPAGGKTTLLKALAGHLHRRSNGLQVAQAKDWYSQVSGSVTYNGRQFSEFQPLRTASYVEQVDTRLIPEMTVRETLDFSARCQGSGLKKDILEAVAEEEGQMGLDVDQEIEAFMAAEALEGRPTSIITEFVIKMLGLEICGNTEVGNALRPACSPGQKKRVTVGEMMVGPQKVHFMDEISTGLDSSTTYQMVKYIRDLTHFMEDTTLIALLQPAPETYELFDDVMLISEGQILYHGPRTDVLSFFSQLGLKCPQRKGVADFLQEVISKKDQQQFWASRHPYRYLTSNEIAERFKFEFHAGIALTEELTQPFSAESQAENDAALVREPYALGSMQIFRACQERELLLVKRNMPLYVIRFMMLFVLALVTATLFIRTRMDPTSIADGNLYFGVVFFSLVQLMFDGVVEMQLTQERLPGWFKQRDNNWLTAWAYVFCTTLLRLPFSLIDASMWAVLVYFCTGLAPEAGRFFTYLLFLFLLHTLGISMFRFVAALCRDETVMAVVGSAFFLVLILLGGFLLSAAKIPVYFKWIYYGVNPIAYAQKSMAVNEFGARRWQSIVFPNGQTLGNAILQARGLPTEDWWRWVGVGVLCFAILLYNTLTWLCHAYLQPLDKPSGQLPISLQEKIAEEREMERAAKSQPRGSVGLTPEQLKTQQQKMRRASIAMGVLSAAATVQRVSKEMIDTAVDAMQRIPSLRRSKSDMPRPSSKPVVNKGSRPVRSSIFVGPSATLSSAASTFPLMDSHTPTGSFHIAAVAGTRGGDEVAGSEEQAKPAGITFASRRKASAAEASAETGKGTDSVIEGGMVLPFEPLSLSFNHVNYYVPLPKTINTTDPDKAGRRLAVVEGTTMLQLLTDCSGAFQPGVLTALLGSSGAGKTTLMDVLCGRKTGGKVTGSIMVGGFPKEERSFARIMGYCQQEDVHAPFTTVHEALWFSCRLRFTNDINDVTARAFVDEVMELVELEPIKGSLVGTPGQSGLSVEQRKRLTIAVELVANPSIVFMDEPTSGLDARAAAIVMRTVRNTVDTGRTVVCTIHQPSIDIFETFDDLLLVKLGGRVIYHGKIGPRSHDLVSYFEGDTGVPALPEGLNPATWILQISTLAMENQLKVDFAELYAASQTYRDNLELIEKLALPEPGKQPLEFATRFSQTYFSQYRLLVGRNFVSYYRNSGYNCTRFIFGIILGLLFGSALWDIGQKRSNLQDLNNVLGELYLVMVFLGIINATSVQPVAYTERSVSHRECPAGMYSSIPFGLAQCSVELPYVFMQCLFFGVISYWMIGFEPSAGKFFWYIFVIYLSLCIQTFYGIMVVYATPNLPIAGVLSSLFFGIWNLFTGFLIGHQRMPKYYSWYYYLNPFAYSLQGIVLSQLGDVVDLVALPDGGYVSVKDALTQVFGYHYSFLGYNILIMIAFSLIFIVSGLIALHKLRFENR